MPPRRVIVALAAFALLPGRPATGSAQDPMPGMKMSGHIMIPKGAIYTVADVEFMHGMIAHHSQAIYMSRMAAAHHANPRVLKLATKIDQSQLPEIRIMQEWLRRYDQFAPDTGSWRTMMMPGMLTAAQLRTLEASSGVAFDRAFLELMMQHHLGALTMVDDLFAVPGAGQEVNISVFANDVVVAQTAEIGIMRRMLADLPEK